MKKVVVFLLLLSGFIPLAPAQVSISRDNHLPDSSAMLDIQSTSGGLLIPRMTPSQRDSIVSPAPGLLVFCTGENRFYFNSGSADSPLWNALGSHWILQDSVLHYPGGKVGIGTSTPDSLLSLPEGGIHARGGRFTSWLKSPSLDTLYRNIRAFSITIFGADADSSAAWNSACIATAVQTAGSLGLPIFIPGDTFAISEQIIIPYDHSGIVGTGCLKKDPSFNPDNDYNMVLVSGDHATIEGITLDGNYVIRGNGTGTGNPVNIMGNGHVVRNCRIINFAGHTYGIFVNEAKNITLEENFIRGGDPDDQLIQTVTHATEGIEVSFGSENITVRNNAIASVAGNGIYTFNSRNIKILNNTVDSSFRGIDIVQDNSIQLTNAENIQVRGNTLRHNQFGIMVEGTAGQVFDAVISDNLVKNASEGIQIKRGQQISVESNCIRHITNIAVLVEGGNDINIRNNQIHSSGYGLFLWQNPARINLLHNTIGNTDFQNINCLSADTLSISGNSFYGSNGLHPVSLIEIDSTHALSVRGNMMAIDASNVQSYMKITNSSGLLCRENSLFGQPPQGGCRIKIINTSMAEDTGPGFSGESFQNIQSGFTTNDGFFIGIDSATSHAMLLQHENKGIDLYTNNQPRVTIDNTGKMGIGTETPAESLHVNGKVIIASVPPFPGIADSALITSNGVIGKMKLPLPGEQLYADTVQWDATRHWVTTQGYLQTFTESDPVWLTDSLLYARKTWVEQRTHWTKTGNDIFAANSGNTGIGTLIPASKLHVSGDIRCDSTLHVSRLIHLQPVSQPVNGTEGDLYYDAVQHKIGVMTNTGWRFLKFED